MNVETTTDPRITYSDPPACECGSRELKIYYIAEPCGTRVELECAQCGKEWTE